MKKEKKLSSIKMLSSIPEWINYLEKKLSNLTTLKQIEELFFQLAKDSAWIYNGGSGNRSRFFLIDNKIQFRFDFDRNDYLISFAVFPQSKKWTKTSDGILVSAEEISKSDLIVL